MSATESTPQPEGVRAHSLHRMVRRHCPSCGGQSGMEYHATLFTLRHYDWDGEDFEVDVERSKFPMGGKCMDCGKAFRFRALDARPSPSLPPNDRTEPQAKL